VLQAAPPPEELVQGDFKALFSEKIRDYEEKESHWRREMGEAKASAAQARSQVRALSVTATEMRVRVQEMAEEKVHRLFLSSELIPLQGNFTNATERRS